MTAEEITKKLSLYRAILCMSFKFLLNYIEEGFQLFITCHWVLILRILLKNPLANSSNDMIHIANIPASYYLD